MKVRPPSSSWSTVFDPFLVSLESRSSQNRSQDGLRIISTTSSSRRSFLHWQPIDLPRRRLLLHWASGLRISWTRQRSQYLPQPTSQVISLPMIRISYPSSLRSDRTTTGGLTSRLTRLPFSSSWSGSLKRHVNSLSITARFETDAPGVNLLRSIPFTCKRKQN